VHRKRIQNPNPDRQVETKPRNLRQAGSMAYAGNAGRNVVNVTQKRTQVNVKSRTDPERR